MKLTINELNKDYITMNNMENVFDFVEDYIETVLNADYIHTEQCEWQILFEEDSSISTRTGGCSSGKPIIDEGFTREEFKVLNKLFNKALTGFLGINKYQDTLKMIDEIIKTKLNK